MTANAHTPKLRAIFAYSVGALSETAAKRLERHLAICDACMDALAAADAYESSVGEARAIPAPTLDWTKMESRLELEAHREARKLRMKPALPFVATLAIAAAALLAFFLSHSGAEVARTDELPPIVTSPEVLLAQREEALASALATGFVTALNGRTSVGVNGTEQPLLLRSEIQEGARLRTEGRLDLVFADGTGAAMSAGTSVRVARLRAAQVELELEVGTLSSQVRAIAPQGRYVVRSGPYDLAVKGTSFSASKNADHVAVFVEEGEVDVSRAGTKIAEVRAGQIWRGPLAEGYLGIAAAPASESDPEVAGLMTPFGIRSFDTDWPTVNVATSAKLRSYRVGQSVFSAAENLAMRAPEGPLDLYAIDKFGAEHHVRIVVDANGASISESDFDGLSPDAPRHTEGTLSEDLILPVVRAGQRAIAACQLRAERAGETVSGRMTVRILIDRRGEVGSASVIKPARTMSGPLLEACVRDEVERWHFPPPTGGTVTFDLPLSFTHRD